VGFGFGKQGLHAASFQMIPIWPDTTILEPKLNLLEKLHNEKQI
jgi:hypothetical protein